MASDSAETGPGVYVVGIDKAENTGPIYEALRQAGCAWRGQALSLNEALRQLELIKKVKTEVALVVVRADLARRGEEAALLEPLARWPLVVLLGVARADRKADIGQLPNVRAVVLVPPYDFSVIRTLALENSTATEPVAATVAPDPPARREAASTLPPALVEAPVAAHPAATSQRRATATGPRSRLAFFGAHGGVGTSTAALRAAHLLAEQGRRVALFDAAQRGDLHVMLGCEPTPQPVQRDLITVYLGEPSEDLVGHYEALVIDGGRRHGTFNAQWIEVSKPLDDSTLRRLSGLPPADQTGAAQPARRLSLSKFLSFEVTE